MRFKVLHMWKVMEPKIRTPSWIVTSIK
jgi:hypothetical protein